MSKFITYLTYLGAGMATLSVLIVIFMVSLNVCLRYFFNQSILFVFEYSEYLLVVIIYMGLAYTARTGSNITVDLVVKRLPKRARDGLELLTLLVTLGVISIYLWFVWDIFKWSVVVGKKAVTTTQTPEWIPHSILVIGLAFLIPEIVADIVRKSRDFQRGRRKRMGDGVPEMSKYVVNNKPE